MKGVDFQDVLDRPQLKPVHHRKDHDQRRDAHGDTRDRQSPGASATGAACSQKSARDKQNPPLHGADSRKVPSR